jgi:hypothetical protein
MTQNKMHTIFKQYGILGSGATIKPKPPPVAEIAPTPAPKKGVVAPTAELSARSAVFSTLPPGKRLPKGYITFKPKKHKSPDNK